MEGWNQPTTWVGGLLATGVAAAVRFTFGTRKALQEHKTYAAEHFATKDEMNRSNDNLTAICTRIETKLDGHIAALRKRA